MKKFINSIFLVLEICAFAACKPLSSAVFQDESCSPPCWNQITPGQTFAQEINAKLKSISAVDVKTIKTKSILQVDDGVAFKFFPGFREDAGEIFSQGGTIEAIGFGIKPNTLKLSEVLQEWGPPNQYIAIYYSKAEVPYLVISIIYTERGIILNNIRNMSADEIPKFEKDFPIQSVWFTKPDSTTVLLENGLIDLMDYQDVLDGLQPWVGFEEIHYVKKDHSGFR